MTLAMREKFRWVVLAEHGGERGGVLCGIAMFTVFQGTLPDI
jgi:hypothetical protein